MDKPLILTKENAHNEVAEMTAYHLQDLRILEKMPALCKLNLVGGEVSELYALNLELTKVDNFSSLQEIKSIQYLKVAGIHNQMIPTISKMTGLKHLQD